MGSEVILQSWREFVGGHEWRSQVASKEETAKSMEKIAEYVKKAMRRRWAYEGLQKGGVSGACSVGLEIGMTRGTG